MASARGEAGTTGAATLQRPIGARALAMAEAFTAVPGGLDSAAYNPAGLAAAKRPILESSYTHGIIEDSFGYLGYAHPLPFAVIDVGAEYYDAGSVHLTLSNGTDAIVKAEQDYVGMLGAAIPLPFDLSVGAIAKYYRFTLAQAATATGFAADLGAQWRSPVKGLTFGAAIQNAGPDVKFEQEGDKLPLTARAGAAFALDLNPNQTGPIKREDWMISQFLFTADAIQTRGSPIAAAAGVEMAMPYGEKNRAALRGGYVLNDTAHSASFGVGLKQGHFLIDYALGVTRALNNTHNFSLGIEF
jgi:hypothetical protein